MAAMRVVPPFDEFEDRHARLDLSFEVAPVKQFAFEGGEEALAHGVVEAIAYGTHRRPHTCRLTALAKGQRTNSVRRWVAMAQPAMRRLKTSSTTPRGRESPPMIRAHELERRDGTVPVS